MIAVHTNIPLHAHREDAAFHRQASDRLTMLAEGPASWGIPWPCLYEFLAVVTHPLIDALPTLLDLAIDQINAWLQSPTLALTTETTTHWPTLPAALLVSRATGPRVCDARVAALCRQHGMHEPWSADRDFGRFAGITIANPSPRLDRPPPRASL